MLALLTLWIAADALFAAALSRARWGEVEGDA